MIRFIFKRKILCNHTGSYSESFSTLDLNLPEVEATLMKNGFGDAGFDTTEFHGIEFRPGQIVAVVMEGDK